ncbi:CoA-binding protein [uncultured Desulfuromonas sp.]|uniref:CoA-binding protein n=1 Tax=uncultured Desulfuromonas sp. TaxID=181013 RepID=UPI002AABFF3E|nr:CoA-binding protein [uncultured Desulfuromonas sp.]
MDPIQTFLSANHYAVAGASTNRDKYGNKVLRCYQQNNKQVTPINPRAETIEGLPCASSVADLDDNVESLSIITPPKITTEVVKSAIAKGIKNIWMQPGAESDEAVALCKENGINVIADGSCLLVVLHYHEH